MPTFPIIQQPVTPIRETPVVAPLNGTQIDKNIDLSALLAVAEPVLAVQNIQGNVLGGFNKDFQMNLYVKITDPKLFKTWLQAQAGFISTAAEVVAFNRLFKDVRSRSGRDGRIKATWFNIAFTFTGLSKLVSDASALTDLSFKKGLFAQAAPVLGDHGKGDPKNWLVGGNQATESDVVLIVAADDEGDMLAEVERLERSLEPSVDASGKPTSGGATIVLADPGTNLPPPLSGHEHFGFLDGISQPGVRGTVSATPTDFLTPRQVAGDPNVGKPGQDLIWPGAFVFGYQGGDPADFLKPGPVVSGGPAWTKDGSYLVLRRLHQDVPTFHTFLKKTAETLQPPIPASASSSPARFVGSRMVGRWPSGCPVLRSTNDDNFALGNDDCANNNFDYQDSTAAVPHPTQPGQCDEDFPNNLSPGDKTGIRCPFSGHLRKTYPRDDIDPKSNEAEKRRLLRRGIPYGPVSPSSPDAPVFDKVAVDRGLQFLSYQTSIPNQFEFIIQSWVNNANFLKGGTGVDPILGQNPSGGPRSFEMIYPLDATGKPTHPQVMLTTSDDWVWATGGGYFFTPSIDAIKTHIAV